MILAAKTAPRVARRRSEIDPCRDKIRSSMTRSITLLIMLLASVASAQPLVITAPAAPGGGWDQTARAMQRVLTGI